MLFRSGLMMWGFHWMQWDRSSEQPADSICRRWAPKSTDIPARNVVNGNVPGDLESSSPLGIRTESAALSERIRPSGKMILAAALNALWITQRCGAPAVAVARQVL